MSSASVSQMAWTNGERISLSYFSDNPGLKKTLLKMLVIDSNAAAATAASPNKGSKQSIEPKQQMDIKQNVGDINTPAKYPQQYKRYNNMRPDIQFKGSERCTYSVDSSK